MVISSLSEGGANVVSEAAVAGVPVLASRMDGNVGLLGVDYPGYFPVGDTNALARLLQRLENEPPFVARLEGALARRTPLFRPARETAAWRRLITDLQRQGPAVPARRHDEAAAGTRQLFRQRCAKR